MTENGLEHEAGLRRANIAMKDVGLDESCEGVLLPGMASSGEEGQVG